MIEVHVGTSFRRLTFTDWTAEMKAKASICISQDDTLIESLEIAKHRIEIMIKKGMDNEKQAQGLVDSAEKRIQKSVPATSRPNPDADANYYAEFTVDLDKWLSR